MIELYYWTSPNAYKVIILLQELELPHRMIPVDITDGAQHSAEFLAISPSGKIPALVDRDPDAMENPLPVFESNAMLLHLAEKTGQFIPSDPIRRNEMISWLFWQGGNFGPVLGQAQHFRAESARGYPEIREYWHKEADRLYRVLDRWLEDRDYIAGEYGIADMACYPWAVLHEKQGLNLPDYPNLMQWYFSLEEREAVECAYDLS